MVKATLVILMFLIPLAATAAQVSARDRALNPYRAGFEEMRAESFGAAVTAFSEATRIDPSFEMAFYMLGRAHMAQKRYVEAIRAFTEAQRLYRFDAGRQFSSAQEAQRYRRDAITEIDEYLRELQSARQTTQIQEQIRQLNERKRQLQDIVSRGNNMTIELAVPAYVSLSLGSAHFRAGHLADAEKAYLEAIQNDPRAGEAHNNLAVVYFETGRYDEADRAVRAAERTGVRVHPELKADIAKKLKDR